jgi:vitamin B12 transporter
LSAGWDHENYVYSIALNGPTDSTTFPFSSSDWMSRLTLDAHANVRWRPTDVLTIGATLEREGMEGTTLDTSRSRNNSAVYLQLVTGPERPVSVTLGARFDENEQFGAWGTYRAGVSIRLARHTRGIASVGTGFKEPSFYQNFATGFVRGNPDLKPEHSFSWEFGLEQTIAASARVRATYFNQQFRDLIDYNGADPDTNYFNVPGANASGLEVGVDAPLWAALRLTAGYMSLNAHVTEGGASTGPTALFTPGATLIRRAWNSGNAGLTYLLKGRGSLAVTALYVGDREDVDYATFQRVTLDAYMRWDLAARVDVIRARGGAPGLGARLRIENLFDQSYEEVKNFPARRRTIIVGAQVGFGY